MSDKISLTESIKKVFAGYHGCCPNDQRTRAAFAQDVSEDLSREIAERTGYPPPIILRPVFVQGDYPGEVSLVDVEVIVPGYYGDISASYEEDRKNVHQELHDESTICSDCW